MERDLDPAPIALPSAGGRDLYLAPIAPPLGRGGGILIPPPSRPRASLPAQMGSATDHKKLAHAGTTDEIEGPTELPSEGERDLDLAPMAPHG